MELVIPSTTTAAGKANVERLVDHIRERKFTHLERNREQFDREGRTKSQNQILRGIDVQGL